MADVSPGRRAAFETILRSITDGAYADRVLRRAAAGLDGRDRALAKQLAFGATQRRGTLDWVLRERATAKKLETRVRAALHLGLYELLFMATADHAAVSEAVELAKPSRGSGLVNAVLRGVLRDPVQLPPDEDPAGAAIRHSHPQWLVELWWQQLGAEQTRALLAADNEPAELALRINTLVDPNPAGLPPGRRDGDAYVVEGPFDLAGSPLFASGAITPMSRAAQLVAPILDPQPGERILDLCAAPGGKTAHIAALMGDDGTIVAVERHAARAADLLRTLERLHVRCARVEHADARSPLEDQAPFDRVLLDPPCSGLGTLRTHPDLRWQMTPQRIAGLISEQDELVEAARAALKPGGTLVYSTCTINVQEERVKDSGAVRTFPHLDATDGFYIARA